MMKRNITLFLIIILAGISIVTILGFFISIREKPSDTKDINIEYKTCEEVTQMIHEGKVDSIEYDPMSLQAIRLELLTITLKDGLSFYAGPIKCVLLAIEECGDLCKNIQVIRTCGQNCI